MLYDITSDTTTPMHPFIVTSDTTTIHASPVISDITTPINPVTVTDDSKAIALYNDNNRRNNNNNNNDNNTTNNSNRYCFVFKTKTMAMAVASIVVLSLLLTVAIVPGAMCLLKEPTGTGRSGIETSSPRSFSSTDTITGINSGSGTAPQTGSETGQPLRVCAFNIRHFGKSLMGKSDVVSNLLKIFRRYDIVLVQEVRDSSHAALRDFQDKLNAEGERGGGGGEEEENNENVRWAYVSSQPLGRSRYYREQYVYFYKTSKVKVISSHQVLDSAEDDYEREPFTVDIEYSSSVLNSNNGFSSSSTTTTSTSTTTTTKRRVVLLGLHAKPDDADAELQTLPATIRATASRFQEAQGVVAMGDFNADCSYLNKAERSSMELFRDNSDFDSLIPDSADTTVSPNTDCAYDRIVVYRSCPPTTGSESQSGSGNCLDVRGAAVLDFEDFLKIDADQASEISDHYPVEFLLY